MKKEEKGFYVTSKNKNSQDSPAIVELYKRIVDALEKRGAFGKYE